MKSPEELFEENYKGFVSFSAGDAYKKGFMKGALLTSIEYRKEVIKIVDSCFHAYASSFRDEAKVMAEELLDRQQEQP